MSTWVILGVGGAMALAVHPIDDDLNEELQENNGVKNFFKPGKDPGYGRVQTGVAVGTYLIGRYAMKSDNVHFLSDVLFGSAPGMASGWTDVGAGAHERGNVAG